MAGPSLPRETIRQFQALFSLGVTAALSDADLLDRFLIDAEQAAFEALVERHGPMVLSVCKRVLSNPHDAEDAFQATFLVLVKKARTIGRAELLANWLYGVAYRTAMEARGRSARRRAREQQVKDMSECEDPHDCEDRDDLRVHLDAELNRLPEKYRTAIVMCDLEGLSRKIAAQKLGVREGTLSSRLTRGRGLLRDRLARRGLALSAPLLASALAREAGSAFVSPLLVDVTVQAAIQVAAGHAAVAGLVSASALALSQGVIKSMLLNKLKLATVSLFTAGAITTGVYVQAQDPAVPVPNAPSLPALPSAVVGTSGPALPAPPGTPSVPNAPSLTPLSSAPGGVGVASADVDNDGALDLQVATTVGQDDRLANLEKKLDRLIEVLERRSVGAPPTPAASADERQQRKVGDRLNVTVARPMTPPATHPGMARVVVVPDQNQVLFTTLQIHQTSLQDRLASLEQRFQKAEKDIKQMNDRIDRLEQQTVGKPELKGVLRRLSDDVQKSSSVPTRE